MDSLIRKCIDKIRDDIEGACNSATPGTTNCLSCLQLQYFNDNPISYNCLHKVCIYVARFFPVHVKENTMALNLIPLDYENKLINQNQINIMSIGGGPGSDSYAIKKYLVSRENMGDINSEKKVFILRVDKERNWDGIAGEINRKIPNTNNIKFDAKKQLLDITEKNNWPEKNYKNFNVFSMSYFLSELDSDEQVKTVAEFINMYSSRHCSFIFVNDRNDNKVNYFKMLLFENLHCNTRCEIENSTQSWCGFHYIDGDRDLVKPKLNTNSIRFFKALYI